MVGRTRIAIVASAAAVACSALTSLDDLRGDASIDASDAYVDASEADALDASDVDALDASGASDAVDATPFCAPFADASLVYCEAFDTPEDASTLVIQQYGAVTSQVDTLDFVSPPASFDIHVAAADGGSLKSAIAYTVGVEPRTATVDFDIRVDSSSPGSNIFTIVADGVNGARIMALVMQPGHVAVQEALPTDAGTNYVDHTSIAFNLADDQWHALHFVFDLISKTDALAIDGTSYESNYPLQPGWVVGLFTLNVGVTYEIASTAWSMRVDNILAQLTL